MLVKKKFFFKREIWKENPKQLSGYSAHLKIRGLRLAEKNL